MTLAATAPSRARRIGAGTGLALGAAAALALAIILAVSVGAVAVPVPTVWGVVLDRLWPGLVTPAWSTGQANIVWEIRFPRVILAGLVGAGLGLAATAAAGLIVELVERRSARRSARWRFDGAALRF